ncbi:hypothetical protein ACF0H5_000564 [Mactra antiquata]
METAVGEYSNDFEKGGKVKSGLKTPLRLPPTLKRKISLSDIIAATIGEEARFGDFQDELNVSHNNSFTEPNFLNVSFNQADGQGEVFNNENSNNACDVTAFKKSCSTSTKVKPTATDHGLNISTGDSLTNIGFDTSFDFLSDIFQGDNKFQPDEDSTTTVNNNEIKQVNSEDSQQASYDSDLEDSMHFVDPDDKSFHGEEQTTATMSGENILEFFKNSLETVQEPVKKRSRLSLHETTSCPLPLKDNIYDTSPEFMELFDKDCKNEGENPTVSKNSLSQRHRSFSGHVKPKLSRQRGKHNLLHMHPLSSFTRHRSFSEACTRKQNSSFDEGFNSILSVPEDLKSLLLSDCQTIDCPRTLFETLSNTPKQDVYARERNLQAKFSTLQSKYPDEVRDLSGFYRQQSAEIETERLKKIHDGNMPTSYRKHLNNFYDDQLHLIMERVEKSLGLLSTMKREFVSVNRHFKSRPMLSKRAVTMMEEWYSRNYEHPYPSQTAVEALACAGEITPEQVKKWFANKRNRNKNTKPVPEIANIKRKRQFSARW